VEVSVFVEMRNEDSELAEPRGVSEERQQALVGQILRGELTPQEACESEGLSELELKRWVRAYTRAARRAIDDQVAAALAAHGLDVDDRPTTEFSGNLGSVGLPELIQTIQYGRKDAHIRIEHDGTQSELWCMQGDVVDAESAQLTGSAAVYRILSIERGNLHADFAPVDRSRTIHASTQALMLEAAKRADESAEIRSRIGDTLNIYVPSASAPSELEIEPDQAAVLRAFDGERSIDDVVHQSELPDLETLQLIARLLEQEWLVLAQFQPLARVQRRMAPRAATPSVIDASFRPLATSLASRLSLHEPRQRLWASAFAGVAVVSVAFAIGFYSARSEEQATSAALRAPVCGAQRAALPGGLCIDRAEVSAGDYQACVRAGACESVQREFDEPAPGAGSAEPAAPVAGGVGGVAGVGGVVGAVAGAAPGAAAPGAAAPAAPTAAASGMAPANAGGGALPASTAPVALTATEPTGAGPTGAGPAGVVPSAGGAAAPGATTARATAGALEAGPAGSLAVAPATQPSEAASVAGAAAAGLTAHCNAGLEGREHLAVNCVTYQQARRYCEWRGGRLPLRTEWEFAASPERAGLGVRDLVGGLSEWTIEPATGVSEAARERSVVLGGGLDTGAGAAGSLTRLYMNANAQGRSVGFRCVVQAETPSATSTPDNREPAPR